MIDLDDQDRKREAAPVGPYAIATFTVDGAQRIVTAPKQFICNTLHGNDTAIAEFIVAACNANEELVSIVRDLAAKNPVVYRRPITGVELPGDRLACNLCGAFTEDLTGEVEHDEECPWRRAVEATK